MSRSRAEEVDTSLLAAQGAVLERRFPLSDLERLRGSLAAGEHEAARHVHARFGFGTEEGRAVALVEIEACLPLVCQRCLGVTNWPVKTRSRLAFVDAAHACAADSGERDNFATSAGRVALQAIAEEELLLALPLVAMHSDPAECTNGTAGRVGAEARMPADAARRPFAGLKELLGRK